MQKNSLEEKTEEVLSAFDKINNDIDTGRDSIQDIFQKLSYGSSTSYNSVAAAGPTINKMAGEYKQTDCVDPTLYKKIYKVDSDETLDTVQNNNKENINSNESFLDILDTLILENNQNGTTEDDQEIVPTTEVAPEDDQAIVPTTEVLQGKIGPSDSYIENIRDSSESLYGGYDKDKDREKGQKERKRWLKTRISDYFTTLTSPPGSVSGSDSKFSQLTERNKWLRLKSERTKNFNEKVRNMYINGEVWCELDELRRQTLKKEIDPELPDLQDTAEKPVMIGGDVQALYPSMDGVATAELAARAVLESDLSFHGIDYKFLAVYILLIIGADSMKKQGLSNVIPVRINTEKYPETKSLCSKINRNMDNWRFDESKLGPKEKRILLSQLVKITTLVVMNSTCYSFGGVIYLQRAGAGIGLRGSAALARVVMSIWDKILATLLKGWKFTGKLYVRYIDDIRIYGPPIGANWYWRNMSWEYDTSTEDLRDPRTRTCEELNKVFDSIFDFLRFTTENELDFTDGYLPTLDVKTKVLDNGKIDYSFFMKPMKNNLVIQRGTALSRQIVFSSLRQEVVRRLINTREATDMENKT